VLERAFSLVPDYLVTGDAGGVVNLMDYGVQLGRRFRALKLWMVIRAFGVAGLAERIRRHCALAREFAAWVDAAPGWERLAPVPLSTVCFRFAPRGAGDAEGAGGAATLDAVALDALNERIMHRVNASGEAYLSHTKLAGRTVLRLAIGNIRTEERHVRRAWELLQDAARSESS
jgi:aromatic-L-amino-acid decarboxylase